ncbi:alanine racemase [Stappia sp. ES.058]|uniref:alanine racemase n=1 Tax=Stappia sp. ES.058 TaxID=1881061 RepID=UPI00087D99E5|nr:alanine racemase [Stappia sp. ES.058]SDU31742.1 D-serine deaminase, pyridoxal phosphate-dependent [Stappia sp. ES.058]
MTAYAPETPALVIDERVATANIARFQAHCDAAGLALRPHIKTHKLPHFARAQIAAGACGITVQKIGEAEVMADAGIADILLTYNILGVDKLARLAAVARRVERLAVVADSAVTVAGLGEAFSREDRPLTVLVECDTGAGRCGVQTPEAAAGLATTIAATDGLVFGGLMTYPAAGGSKDVESFMRAAKSLIETAGIACPTITSGGSPDMWKAGGETIVTEYRAGTYIYNDRSLVAGGACSLDDCALTVEATVVSTPTPTRAILDAGSKALSSDLLGLTGHGTILGHPDAAIVALSEEHAIVHTKRENEFEIGQRVSIVPNHACVVTNLFNFAWLIGEDGMMRRTEIAARGKLT